MAERYKQLLKTGMQYQKDCPVLLSAAALLLDMQTQHVFAQLKLQSSIRETISAVCVALECYDPSGSTVTCHEEFWYRDLKVKFSEQFGQKTAIPISKDIVRSFSVRVKTIIYSNGNTWEAADSIQVMQNIPNIEPLDVLLGVDLSEQYYRECKKLSKLDIKHSPRKHQNLVLCACGAIYTSVESTCPLCGIGFDDYEKLISSSYLSEQLNKYQEERKKAAEKTLEMQKIAAEKKQAIQKRTRKRVIIALFLFAMTVAFTLLALLVFVPSSHYRSGEGFLAASDYEKAIIEFTKAGDYQDAADRILSAYYRQAEDYFAAQKYEQAIISFQKAGSYEDSAERIQSAYYLLAKDYFAAQNYVQAIICFQKAESFQDAWNKITCCYKKLGVAISVDAVGAVGLRTDGTVLLEVNDYHGEFAASEWHGILAISAGYDKIVGLKTDGTVVAAGRVEDIENDISGWRNIIAISTGKVFTVGLKADGTVVVAAGGSPISYDVSGWQDIVSISTGERHIIGLKADGTVVATGGNFDGQCDVSTWRNITAIAAGYEHSVGLKADGTVVAAGNNINGECDVASWRDIVDIGAEWNGTAGLKADGTVVAAGQGYDVLDLSDFRDIVDISGGYSFIVCVKADGTATYFSGTDDRLGDITQWKLWP